MDRVIPQPGSLVLVEDVLKTARASMVGDGALARMVMGAGPWLDGFAAVPVPGALALVLQPGTLLTPDVVDSTDYGVLGANNRACDKQFRLKDAAQVAIPGAGTWTVQAAASETDIDPAVLQYFNAANPTQALSGPGGTATAQYTTRAQAVLLSVRAGTVVDSDHVGLYVVVVPDGATALTAGMVTRFPDAPFVDGKLPSRAPIVSPHFREFPKAPTAPEDDASELLANTAFVTRAINKLKDVDLSDILADLARLHSGHVHQRVFHESVLWTVPDRVTSVRARCVGGGGGSCGSSEDKPGAGGGGGGYAEGVVPVTPGQQIAVIIGTQGLAAGTIAQATNGASSSFGPFLGATGGGGSVSSADGYVAGGTGGYGYGPYAAIATTGGDGGDGFSNGFQFPGYGGSTALAGSARASTGDGHGGGAYDGRWPGGGAAATYGYVAVGANGGLGTVILEWWSTDND